MAFGPDEGDDSFVVGDDFIEYADETDDDAEDRESSAGGEAWRRELARVEQARAHIRYNLRSA